MSKKLIFVSGLPRSCSTLLMNLLAQNPNVHSSGTSGLHEIGYIARKIFHTEEAKATGGEIIEKMYFDYVKHGCENAYNSITDRPIVADKCRSWIGHLDQLYKIWPDAKVLVPVRDIRGILISLEKKRIQHPTPFNGFEEANPSNFTTIEKRAQGWLSNPPVGIAIERLHDAISRYKNRLHFVHAEDLTSNPKETMQTVWNYLGEEFNGHDFDNVEQYTHEIDVGFPYGDHTIRNKVEPLKSDWQNYLGRELSEMIRQKFDWVNHL